MYNRKALKQEAKQMIRASVPHFMLVTLVYYLLTAGLSTLVDWMSNAFPLPYGGGVLILFLTILVRLFSLVMGVGFANYSLRLARREETGWNSLFHPFSYSGRAMGLPLLVMLYSVLWYLAVMAAAAILLCILCIPVMYSPWLWPIFAFGWIIVYMAALAALIFLLLRYGMAEFVLVDYPDVGVLECIRRSIRMLRGYKGKLFVLHLSFLGWKLLVELIVLAVMVIGLFASGSMPILQSLIKMMMDANDPETISRVAYRLVYFFMDQMFLWMILAELLSLPLNLWLMVYQQTAWARFYNYVGGYDYHQFMISHQPQQPQTPQQPQQPTVWTNPNPTPDQPAGQPIGGYYTPQPNVLEPPVIPAPSQPPLAHEESAGPTPEAPPEETSDSEESFDSSEESDEEEEI